MASSSHRRAVPGSVAAHGKPARIVRLLSVNYTQTGPIWPKEPEL